MASGEGGTDGIDVALVVDARPIVTVHEEGGLAVVSGKGRVDVVVGSYRN